MGEDVCEHENFDEETMKFCPDCGEAMTICSGCEAEVQPEWSYCPYCGRALNH
jgi:rRNA maturation endonuclease Nob1